MDSDSDFNICRPFNKYSRNMVHRTNVFFSISDKGNISFFKITENKAVPMHGYCYVIYSTLATRGHCHSDLTFCS